VVAGADEAGAGGPRGLQRIRAGAAERLADLAEVPEAGAAEMPGPATAEPGLLRSGQPVDRGAAEPVGTFLRKDESVL
jgi:hypothetical protein